MLRLQSTNYTATNHRRNTNNITNTAACRCNLRPQLVKYINILLLLDENKHVFHFYFTKFYVIRKGI